MTRFTLNSYSPSKSTLQFLFYLLTQFGHSPSKVKYHKLSTESHVKAII